MSNLLVIRNSQLSALGQVMTEQFEFRMLSHLQRNFAAQTRSATCEELLVLIRKGIGAAAQYGIKTEQLVAQYIEYTIQFGSDFDSNAKIEWAGRILRNPASSAAEKLERLDSYEQFTLHRPPP